MIKNISSVLLLFLLMTSTCECKENDASISNLVIFEEVQLRCIVDVNAFLILNTESNKFNYYIVDSVLLDKEMDAQMINENFFAQPLDIAKKHYPEFNFTESNYGF